MRLETRMMSFEHLRSTVLSQSDTSKTTAILAILILLTPSLPGFKFDTIRVLRQKLILSLLVPFAITADLFRYAERTTSRLSLWWSGVSVKTEGVSDDEFPGPAAFERVLTKLGESGLRSTANKAHEDFIDWIETELARLPNVTVTEDKFDILRWQTIDGQNLRDAGSLDIQVGERVQSIAIAGVVPYTKPTGKIGSSGEIIYLHRKHKISEVSVKGKIVLRDFPMVSIPMMVGKLPSYSQTSDLHWDMIGDYNRPSFAEIPVHNDLIDAGNSGAAGVIFLVNLPRPQIDSYWDPHQGTHYNIPAVFVGADEAMMLKDAQGAEATVHVFAEVSKATTRNILATLPGQIDESIIYSSHTDGNTYVQENGVAALLTSAQYFSRQPISARRRTIQFAFNTAHLHVSKEGCGRHADQLDADYADGETVLVIPVEHMGTREVDVYKRKSGPGHELRFTGRGEVMIWCVGPSPPLVAAVEQAVARRKLDRVMITRGVGLPSTSRVPSFFSFGGIGTLYHNALIPTTSLISGPWTLFAPSFGRDAVDVHRLRTQTLAVADIYLAVDGLSREQIAGSYLGYREKRARGMSSGFDYPPEQL